MTLWWLGRASGLVAWLALWSSLASGLLVSARGPFDKKATFAVHEAWTYAALGLSALHALVLAANGHGVPLAAVLIPGAAECLAAAVALGTVALWGLGAVAISSWLRARLRPKTWRRLHVVAFATAVLGLAHGIAAGTDTQRPWVTTLYAVTFAAAVGAFVLRVLLTAPKQR